MSFSHPLSRPLTPPLSQPASPAQGGGGSTMSRQVSALDLPSPRAVPGSGAHEAGRLDGLVSPSSVASAPPLVPVPPAPLSQSRRQSFRMASYLPSQAEATRFHVRFAALEQRIHREMSPMARRGFALFANAGKSFSLAAGAVAAWAGFLLAEPHLALVLGVAGAVWGGSLLLGLCIEWTLKWFASRKVTAAMREELRALCVELNAREAEFGSYRHVEERGACERANALWAEIHFSGRAVARTLVGTVADYELGGERPVQRTQPSVQQTIRR